MQIITDQEKEEIVKLLKSQEKIPESIKLLVENQFEFFAYLMTIVCEENKN
jgi:hypothetical protein